MNKVVFTEELRQEIYALAAERNPLNDGIFKIFLQADEMFIIIAEGSLGEKIGTEEQLIDINGEITLTAGGKVIRMDALRLAEMGAINVDGQVDTAKFPFVRHLYYGAAVYVHGLRSGDEYEKLRPVASIVVYKSKRGAALFEEAYLAGNLIKTAEERRQIRLVAVNAAKWREAKDSHLRMMLALLHNGLLTEQNRKKFVGLDTEDPMFARMQEYLRTASVASKYHECLEKGDDFMAARVFSVLSEEEREKSELKGRAEGRAEGIAEGILEGELKGKLEGLAKAAIVMLKEGFAPTKISEMLEQPIEWVENLAVKQ
ncbi:MAG: hypothetical protein FWG65_01660 [Turicibacter sp.]|nr:hypothetical protein [Turicibacter sp.]